ncbi:transposable element Tcb1 transposase [Trichonephila clavipes]|nr:transposable element Tcb1 transposase [Trichonephila clavipes]
MSPYIITPAEGAVHRCKAKAELRCSPHTNTIVTTAQIESRLVTEDDLFSFRCNPLSSCVAPLPTEVSVDESRFNLWEHDDRIRIRRYAGECCLTESVIKRHSGLTPGVMIWGAISYHGRSHLLRIEAQDMQLLPSTAYSPEMSPIQPVWDLIGQRLARNPRPAASKDELVMRIQAIWNSLPQVDIQNLFDSMPRRTTTFIVACGGNTKY